MEFKQFTTYLEKLESTDSRLEMTDIVRQLLLDSGEDLRRVILFVQGRAFPPWDPSELGIAEKMMVRCISLATGISEKKVRDVIAEKGDAGIAAEELFKRRTQTTLFSAPLDLEKLEKVIKKISTMEGPGSQERKTKYVVELLNSVTPREVNTWLDFYLEKCEQEWEKE